MLRPKIWKSEIFVKDCKERKKPKQECHEMEPNPSNDRAMYEGDYPSL
jgi:hypothetical protein